MLGTGYFLKIAKLNQFPARIANLSKLQKLVPAIHKKSSIRKNKLPQKFRATRYFVKCMRILLELNSYRDNIRACLNGGGGPQVGEVTRLSI